MKFKKKLRRGVACGLCVCLAGTCTPVPAYAARTADVSAIENVLARAAEYVQTFETADVSNWVSQANPSTIQVIDGKLDMETDEGNESKVPQCAVAL